MPDEPSKSPELDSPKKPSFRQKKGLGRGLSALLGDEADDYNSLSKLRKMPREVPIEFIVPSSLQPRSRFEQSELESLAESIKNQGILQPILVRNSVTNPDHFEIVAGERRWRAAQIASLTEVPVIVRDLKDSEVLEAAIIENVQREDLTPIEEGLAYKRLIEQFNHTQTALGQIVGRSRSHIANTLRLLKLPKEVQDLLQKGDLTAGHGRALLAAQDPMKMAKEIMKGKWNVRTAEKLAPNKKTKSVTQDVTRKDPNTVALEKNVSDALGYKVDITHINQKSGGAIKIQYRTLDQLDDIVHRLLTPGERI